MRVFDVYRRRDDRRRTIAVERGFSWPAFVTGDIWAVATGLWGFGLLVLGVTLALGLVVAGVALWAPAGAPAAVPLALGVRLAFGAWVGLVANDRRRRWALEHGYVLVRAGVPARSPAEAVEKSAGRADPAEPAMVAAAAS